MQDFLFSDEEFSSIETNKTYEPIPPGNYLVNIIGSASMDTKRGDGKYLKLTFEVATGPHQGRRLWDNQNYVNPNPTAEGIGKRAIKTLALLCGINRAPAPDDFLGRQVTVEVRVERNNGTNKLENKVFYTDPTSSQQSAQRPAAPVQAAPVTAFAAASAGKAPPWARNQQSA